MPLRRNRFHSLDTTRIQPLSAPVHVPANVFVSRVFRCGAMYRKKIPDRYLGVIIDQNIMRQKVVYVYAPRGSRNKAGVRVLYQLTQKLRDLGFDSAVVCHSFRKGNNNLDLQASFFHVLRSVLTNREIITIYPESIAKNLFPLGTPIRYLLALPGDLLTENRVFFGSNLTFAFSSNLAKAWNSQGPVVHLPTIDMSELEEFNSPRSQEYDLVYSGKYVDLHKQKLPIELNQCEVLTRRETVDLDRKKFLSKIYNAKKVYCLENTTVALEALMFGVPVIFLENNKFNGLILESEFGGYGIAKSTRDSEIAFAETTARLAKPKYKEYLSNLDFDTDFIAWLNQFLGQPKKMNFFFKIAHSVFAIKTFRAFVHKVYFTTVMLGRARV